MTDTDTPAEIAALVDHFSSLSTKRAAEAISHDATSKTLRSKIAAAAAAVSEAEIRFPNTPAKVTPLREQLQRLKNERAALRAPTWYDPFPEITAYLARGFKLTPAPLPAIKSLATATKDTDAVLQQIQAVRSAPKPDTQRLSALTENLNALAERGAPSVDANGRLVLPLNAIATKPPAYYEDVASFLLWALKPQVTKALASFASYGDGIGLTDDDRKAQLEALAIDLDAALRAEAMAATEDERQGAAVARRRHIHPAILVNATLNPSITMDHYLRRRGQP